VAYRKLQAKKLSNEEIEELSRKIIEVVERELEEKSKDRVTGDIVVLVNIVEDWPLLVEVEVEFGGRYDFNEKEALHEILDRIFSCIDEYMKNKGYEVSLDVKVWHETG